MGGVQTGTVSGRYLHLQDRADGIAEAEVTILKEFRTQIVIDDVDVIGADMTFEAEIHGSGDGEWFEVGDVTINGYGAEHGGRGRDLVLKRAEARPGDVPGVGLKAELYRLCEAVVRAARKSVGDDLAEEAENQENDPGWPR